MIASYLRKRESAEVEDFGLEKQAEFFERETDRLGKAPPVVDSNDILANPQGVLSKLCGALGIPWDPAMLSWAPGRRPTDGVWAEHWYGAVEASTGFGPPETQPVTLPANAQRLADRCGPYYERLAGFRGAFGRDWLVCRHHRQNAGDRGQSDYKSDVRHVVSPI
jgi:hypothetical protein